MDKKLPNAKSERVAGERETLRRVVARRNLTGLANDTKWDEFIAAMRARAGWRPRFRVTCIDGAPSGWDAEWFYHQPFPQISLEWLDVAYLQQMSDRRLPPRQTTIDHSDWIEAALRSAGLDYRKGPTMIRIFGYAPRGEDLFED